MPTRYTSEVQSGKITDFADFAMSCARAFGACISMRDAPNDAPIPDAFEPSDYNLSGILEAQESVAKLTAMSESDKAEACAEYHRKEIAAWERRAAERVEQKNRYERMLTAVRAWSPPTDDHVGLKDFMVKQLEDSIAWDCRDYDEKPKPVEAQDWYANELSAAHRSMASHAKSQSEEIERARKRTKWVSDLRASLTRVAAPETT